MSMSERCVHPVWLQYFSGRPVAEPYLGLETADARQYAESEGVAEIRELDAREPGLVRPDLRADRLNLLIEDGIVVDARWG